MNDANLRKALEWLVLLRDENSNADDQKTFEKWLKSAPENRVSWDEANQLWRSLEPVKQEITTLRKRDSEVSRRRVLAGLSGLAVVGGAGWYTSRPAFWSDHITVAGETRAITLADGSQINLGSRSSISVDLTPTARRISLLQGEAFFSVVADKNKPFLVTAMGTEITAVETEAETEAGTKFNVHLWGDKATVSVAEHAVKVSHSEHMPVTVKEGWEASFDKNIIRSAVEVDFASIGAWRQGHLVFRSRPLHDVLNVLARHRGGRIIVLDGALGDIPVSAVFDANDPDAALKTIVQTLELKTLNLPANVTLIYT